MQKNKQTVILKSENGYTIKATCPQCGRTFTSPLFSKEKFESYMSGIHAQDAFPEWPASEREFFLISGICGDCFDRIMAEPDEDEEE